MVLHILMTLPARANRRANLVVAPVYVAISVAHAAGESWTYYFAIAIGLEVLVLAMIIRHAWTWPRTARHTAVPQQSDRMQRA